MPGKGEYRYLYGHLPENRGLDLISYNCPKDHRYRH